MRRARGTRHMTPCTDSGQAQGLRHLSHRQSNTNLILTTRACRGSSKCLRSPTVNTYLNVSTCWGAHVALRTRAVSGVAVLNWRSSIHEAMDLQDVDGYGCPRLSTGISTGISPGHNLGLSLGLWLDLSPGLATGMCPMPPSTCWAALLLGWCTRRGGALG